MGSCGSCTRSRKKNRRLNLSLVKAPEVLGGAGDSILWPALGGRRHKAIVCPTIPKGRTMSLREFRRAGHAPTLAAAFLYFDVSFMVWVILGPLAPFLSHALQLSATETGILTALPLLGGSFFRVLLGLMTERIGGRRTGLVGLSLSFLPLAVGWLFASQYWH